MRYILIILLAASLTALPAVSHGFGLLKYVGDAISNQLGLDRGPIPKATPKRPCAQCDPYMKRLPTHVYFPNFHLQAEGF